MKEATLDFPTFIENWRDKPRQQVVEEWASCLQESEGIPDPYIYLVTSRGFTSPMTGQFIREAIKRGNPVGRLEGQEFDSMEDYFYSGQGRTFAWVSPPKANLYPKTKVTITQVEKIGGVEVMSNTGIILDLDEDRCLELAQKLAWFSVNQPELSTVDEVRGSTLILKTEGLFWTHLLEELVPNLSLEDVRSDSHKRAKLEVIEKARMAYPELFKEDAPKKLQEMLGSFDLSCPTTMRGSSSSKFEYKPGVNCRMCGHYGLKLGECNVCQRCEEEDKLKKW